RVGNDPVGKFLTAEAAKANFNSLKIQTDSVRNTTLAFVSLSEDGDRSFSFYRNFGADAQLSREELDPTPIRNATYFHFGVSNDWLIAFTTLSSPYSLTRSIA
ncbi:MAG: hypothetical protein IJ936_06030, partial [Peptococcaceae bacterium]|nr:hypothetical protein [Peptococcaceae bacterium]